METSGLPSQMAAFSDGTLEPDFSDGNLESDLRWQQVPQRPFGPSVLMWPCGPWAPGPRAQPFHREYLPENRMFLTK